jgi:ATP-dependent RNA helicase RhlE
VTTETTEATFDQFPLSAPMRAAIRAAGYQSPTPIQVGTIAAGLEGRDVVGTAQTGTGKTAAFLIPLIERLKVARQEGRTDAAALVLAPTRELAEQTEGWARKLGCGLRTALVVGGLGYGPQVEALRRRPALIIATPGRLVDHLDQRTASLAGAAILVLDEADRMLDMGFKPQLDRILRAMPAVRQTLLFSATMAPEVDALARGHLRQPVRVAVGPQSVPPSRAKQDVYLVDREQKTPLLLSLIGGEDKNTVLVFTRTKHRADRLMKSVKSAGHSVERLHSNRTQAQRRQALAGFRSGRYRILVATDIAARGIDVADIGRVINYDLPGTVEDYVHRVGRTARAETHGHASSFAAPDERGQLTAIERHIGRSLPRERHDTPSERPAFTGARPAPEERRERPAFGRAAEPWRKAGPGAARRGAPRSGARAQARGNRYV